MAEPLVVVEHAGGITTVTLHRPAVRNALDRALMDAVWDAVAEAGADPDVGAVVVTGADPAFCAGIDIGAASAHTPGRPARSPGSGPGRGADGLFRFLPVIDKPVIGAINGACVAGGLELALQCTFLIASERARFADTHARMGMMPGGGVTVGLTRTVGRRRAVELSLTGNFLTAADALAYGLVNHVVPHAQLLPFTHSLAAEMLAADREAVTRLLRHYRALADDDGSRAQLLEGVMAETWSPGTARMAEYGARVIERGREQLK
ncbi:enoyl-CoA hydratase [Nocardia sp. NRRL WC-3656]|uniref:enoyl-CoA hydratase n=1 Tax=Nocardia sp. NRRL WC-3656 TaxID=1463824 RepID=UPI0004C30A45|nr:enoyl-CoA hydratase [Nocardia sp. NRRL WC-3656]